MYEGVYLLRTSVSFCPFQMNLDMMNLWKSMASDAFQDVGSVYLHGQRTATIALGSNWVKPQSPLYLCHLIGAVAFSTSTKHRTFNSCVCHSLAITVRPDADLDGLVRLLCLGFQVRKKNSCDFVSLFDKSWSWFITRVSCSLTALCRSSILPQPDVTLIHTLFSLL